MSASAFSPVPAAGPARRPGGSGPPGAASHALADGGGATAATGLPHRHRLGDALRAVRVYVVCAFRVAVLGEYAEAADPRRR